MPLPLDQAIPRFKQNEERIDIWVNDVDDIGYYVASDYDNVESIPAFMARKETEFNVALDGYTDDAEAAALAAQSAQAAAESAVTAAETAEDNAAGFSTAAAASAAAALTSRNQSQTFANTASAQATAAAGHSTTASTAASTATTAASTAAGHVTTANNAATTAQGFSNSAQGFAEDAEAAVEDVEAIVTGAQTAADAASDSASAAAASQTAAATAASNADSSATTAQVYSESAETSSTSAQAAAIVATESAVVAVNAAEEASNLFDALSGLSAFTEVYTSYYDFDADLPTLADGTYAVASDESFPGNPFSIYTVTAFTPTFVTSLVDGGSSVNWGAIGGSLEDQTDLQAVLTDLNDRVVDLEYNPVTASEVSIIDAGYYFPTTDVEETLQYVGNALDGHTSRLDIIETMVDADNQIIHNYRIDVITVTGSTYEFSNDDTGKLLEFTFAGVVTVTIPEDLFKGWHTRNVVMDAAGQLSYVTAGGATLFNKLSHTDSEQAQFAETQLYCSSNPDDISAAVILRGDTEA